jgi:glycosyltransferase involved in cell wall biosynthesis
MNNPPRIALVRGPGLSVFELQSYEPLLNRYDLQAFGLAQHSVDTDTLGIPVTRLKWKDSVSGHSPLNAYRSRMKGQRYYMPGLEKELLGFDLIHSSEIASTFSWQCAQQKKKLGVPFVITSTENIPYPAWNDPVRLALKKEILQAADFFFALTPDARDVLIGEGVDPVKIEVIPFGIDINRLSPEQSEDEWKRHFSVTDDDFVITYAGRLVWEKGIYDLACAVRRMDAEHLRVLFVGSGAERQNLEAFIAHLGLSAVASIHTAIPYGQMEHLYRIADILVLPSLPTLGVREQFGLTLAEAMACGKPVVATRCGSMPWVVGDAGLLADPGSSTSLADCLNQLRGSPQLRLELGQRGRKIAEERYNNRRVAERIDRAFRALL